MSLFFSYTIYIYIYPKACAPAAGPPVNRQLVTG